MPTRYTGPAMTLANMRENGVRSIEAACECGHRAIVDVSGLPDAFEVPALRLPRIDLDRARRAGAEAPAFLIKSDLR